MVSTKVCISLLLSLITAAESARILCFSPSGPRSHYHAFVPFVETLASRGHDVTVVSQYNTIKHPNVTEVFLEADSKVTQNIDDDVFGSLVNSRNLLLRTFLPYTAEYCDIFLKEEVVLQLLEAGQVYDLVVANGVIHECSMWLMPLIGRHVIALNPTGQVPWEYASVPVPSSWVPMVILPHQSCMDFLQRLSNSWTQLKNRLYYQFVMVPTIQKIVHAHFPQSPTIDEVRQRISLTLSNADPVLYSPRPATPDFIAVGAMHCRPAKPLPEKFVEIMQRSNGNGVVIFSLGTIAPSKDLPLHIRKAFVSAFARLDQLVIWKFEQEMEDLPANVVITSWLPLQDLLGHNETRLFISHGGLLSSQEAVYHGVPIIAIPLFYDQVGNAARMEELGIGEGLQYGELTEEAIYTAVQKILNNKSYSENMQKYSSILRDQPQTPAERAAYWAEYVIRHDGAAHLKSVAAELNFVQYYLLDVALVAFLAFVSVLFITICVGRLGIDFLRKLAKGRTKEHVK